MLEYLSLDSIKTTYSEWINQPSENYTYQHLCPNPSKYHSMVLGDSSILHPATPRERWLIHFKEESDCLMHFGADLFRIPSLTQHDHQPNNHNIASLLTRSAIVVYSLQIYHGRISRHICKLFWVSYDLLHDVELFLIIKRKRDFKTPSGKHNG